MSLPSRLDTGAAAAHVHPRVHLHGTLEIITAAHLEMRAWTRKRLALHDSIPDKTLKQVNAGRNVELELEGELEPACVGQLEAQPQCACTEENLSRAWRSDAHGHSL